MATDHHSNHYRAPAVEKAFKLLDLVAASEHGVGISEMARTLGYSKGSTYGLTQALTAAGALFQSPLNKKFFLGPAMIERYAKSRCFHRIQEKAQPWIERLRDAIGQSVFLGALSPTRGMIIATAEPNRPLKISSPAGNTIPILAGAVGKVFLSALAPHHAGDILDERGLERYTDRTILDRAQYLKELDRVRADGYALDKEEYLPGVHAVAMALRDLKGLMLALWVVGFADALGPGTLPGIVESMRETAATLDRVLPD